MPVCVRRGGVVRAGGAGVVSACVFLGAPSHRYLNLGRGHVYVLGFERAELVVDHLPDDLVGGRHLSLSLGGALPVLGWDVVCDGGS